MVFVLVKDTFIVDRCHIATIHIKIFFITSFFCVCLQYLLDFLTVKGYPSENYKVLSAYPKRDVSFY